ncbi:MAG TPA: hypothetical protein VHD33_02355, partial [Legionellaceae bacterium]|nr:hypothetical protein [Legionellaceae bacterium]
MTKRLISTITPSTAGSFIGPLPPVAILEGYINKQDVQNTLDILTAYIQSAPGMHVTALNILLTYLDQAQNDTLQNAQKMLKEKTTDPTILAALKILIALRDQTDLSKIYSEISTHEKEESINYIAHKLNLVYRVVYSRPVTADEAKKDPRRRGGIVLEPLAIGGHILQLLKFCDMEQVSVIGHICYILATAMHESRMGVNMVEMKNWEACLKEYNGLYGNDLYKDKSVKAPSKSAKTPAKPPVYTLSEDGKTLYRDGQALSN